MQKKVFYAVFNTQTSLTETGDTTISDAGSYNGSFYSFHAGGEFVVEDFKAPVESVLNVLKKSGSVFYVLSESLDDANNRLKELLKNEHNIFI